MRKKGGLVLKSLYSWCPRWRLQKLEHLGLSSLISWRSLFLFANLASDTECMAYIGRRCFNHHTICYIYSLKISLNYCPDVFTFRRTEEHISFFSLAFSLVAETSSQDDPLRFLFLSDNLNRLNNSSHSAQAEHCAFFPKHLRFTSCFYDHNQSEHQNHNILLLGVWI